MTVHDKRRLTQRAKTHKETPHFNLPSLFGWVLWGATCFPLVVYVDTALWNTLQATHWRPPHPGDSPGVRRALRHTDSGYEYLGLEGSRVRHSLGIVLTTCLSTAVATYRIIIYILYLYIYLCRIFKLNCVENLIIVTSSSVSLLFSFFLISV